MLSLFTNDEMLEFQHEQFAKLRRYWLRNYAENSKRISSDKIISQLPDLKFGLPVAVIGGADTSPDIFTMLKDVKHLTTVCCDKALPRVLPHFRPQFVTALNTQKTEDVQLEKWFADSTDMKLIVPATVHPDTVKLWKGEVYWMNPTNVDDDITLKIQQETGIEGWYRGLNVGEFSLAMASFMRPAEIALFGLWYAWKTKKEVPDPGDPLNYDMVEICNDGVKWYTSIAWLASRSGFIEFCKKLHTQGMQVYNASMGGLLYHPDFCINITPAAWIERWQDETGVSKGRGVPEEEEAREETAECEDHLLQLPKLRVRDASDEHYGGD